MNKLPTLHVPKPIIDEETQTLLRGHGIMIEQFIPHFLSSQNPTGGWHDFWDGLGNEMEEVIDYEKECFYENTIETHVEQLQSEWKVHENAFREELSSAFNMAEQALQVWLKTIPCGNLIVNYPAYDVEESYVPDRILITPCPDE